MSFLPIPGFTKLIKAFLILCCCMAPLAVWKLIDIAIWLYQHIQLSIK